MIKEKTQFQFKHASVVKPLSLGAIALFSGMQTHAQERPPNRTLEESFTTHFDAPLDENDWYVSDFKVKGGIFKNSWSSQNVIATDEGVILKLTRKLRFGLFPYFEGGELQRRGWFHYGRFEVVMKAPTGGGVVSGFFTHTNDYFGDPHDEIDIEFLGGQTNSVHLNAYNASRQIGSKPIDMEFDTASAFHLYAFEWTPERLSWSVDDKPIFQVTDADFDIPDTPQRLIAQIWTGRFYDWHGLPTFKNDAQMHLLCMSYQAADDVDAEQCSDNVKLPPQ